jgi:hypothetical protein
MGTKDRVFDFGAVTPEGTSLRPSRRRMRREDEKDDRAGGAVQICKMRHQVDSLGLVRNTRLARLWSEPPVLSVPDREDFGGQQLLTTPPWSIVAHPRVSRP